VRIGIFAERIGTRGGGVETYEIELLKWLMRLDTENSYTVYCSSEDALAGLDVDAPNFRARAVSPSSTFLRFMLALPIELLVRGVDLMHTCMVPPLYSPVRYVMTAHDLATFVCPEFFPKPILFRANMLLTRGIKKAERIISVSESTKRDLLRLFGIKPEKVSVIPLGVDPCYRPMSGDREVLAVRRKYGLPEKYILYVGKIQARKNTQNLVRAFHVLKKKMKVEQKLVMVGRVMWKSDETLREIERLGMCKDILLLGHVNDLDLPAIYNGADVFTFPSLYEGFGLPPLEAMACGVPVVTSDRTSIPEVVGDAGIMVDPLDVEAIAEGVLSVIADDSRREQLISKGLERAGGFTWVETAKKTLELYKEVCAEGVAERQQEDGDAPEAEREKLCQKTQ